MRVPGTAKLVALAAGCVLVAAGGAQTETADAGNYATIVCHDAAGTAMPSDLTAQQATGGLSSAYFRTSDTCAADGQGSVNAQVGGCINCAFGNVGVSYFLNTPPGVSISSYAAQLVDSTRPCDMVDGRCNDGQGETFVIDSQHAAPNFAARSLGQGASDSHRIGAVGLDAKSLQFFAGCNATYGSCQASGVVASLGVSSILAVLDDHTVPAVLAVGGPLISGDVLSGTKAVSYSAQDTGGGIYAEHAYVDGSPVIDRVVDTNGGHCVDHGTMPGMHSFGYVQPCKANVNATMSLDTTQWSNGAHRVTIDVEDAAGERTKVFDGSVTSANGGGTPGGGSGAGRTRRHSITLTISPHATSNHHAMIWRGVVTGGRAKAKLLLEVRKGRRWDIFDQTSSDARGRYRYRYTFRSTTGTVRYTFRVVARDGSATSPSRSILVRG